MTVIEVNYVFHKKYLVERVRGDVPDSSLDFWSLIPTSAEIHGNYCIVVNCVDLHTDEITPKE